MTQGQAAAPIVAAASRSDEVREIERIVAREANNLHPSTLDVHRGALRSVVVRLRDVAILLDKRAHTVLVKMELPAVGPPSDMEFSAFFDAFPEARGTSARFVIAAYDDESWSDVLDGYFTGGIGIGAIKKTTGDLAALGVRFEPMKMIPGQVFMWGASTKNDVENLVDLAKDRAGLRDRITRSHPHWARAIFGAGK